MAKRKTEPIRTLQEVLDKAFETTGESALYAFDYELVNQFNLGTVKGTTEQLLAIIQALRTAAMAVAGAALNDLEANDLDTNEEEPKEKVYEA